MARRMIGSPPERRDTMFGLLFGLGQQPLTIGVGFAITPSREICIHLWLPAIGEGLPLRPVCPPESIYLFRQGINGPVFLLSLPLLWSKSHYKIPPIGFCLLQFSFFGLLRLTCPKPYPYPAAYLPRIDPETIVEL